ncbi:MAG: class I SAM-dependent rRNA methyltransferase [Candidatus Altimarinota bacterium]
MKLKKIYLNPDKEASLMKLRHPWLFTDAIQAVDGIHDGELCDVYLSNRKTFFGRGYFNSKSKIVVRILTRFPNQTIDERFFVERMETLQRERERFIDMSSTNAYRLVFAESDGLPGLIVDRYDQTFVIQIHTLGMDVLKDLVVEALKSVFQPKSIYERSDAQVRFLDGLTNNPSQLLYGEEPTGEIMIKEHGVSFYVDIVHGQKTGLFLDQRENRKALQGYCEGKNVLNCFAYTGGFSLYAALGGASRVTSVDISKNAIAAAERNFQLNSVDSKKQEAVVADVFDYLEDCRPGSFDVIVLDPPAFVKNNKSIKKGMAGYLQINEAALRILPKNGILVSSSCSSYVTDEMFQKMLTIASHRAGCSLKVLEIKHQPPDHPFNIDFPEGKYLKFWILQKAA